MNELIEYRPEILLPEDFMVMMMPVPRDIVVELVDEANLVLKKAWGYIRKQCPVLTIRDFRPVSEKSLAHPLSNKRRAQYTCYRNEKSFDNILTVTVQYRPVESVAKSRRHGFSFNFSHYLIIALDLDNEVVRADDFTIST